MSYPKKPQIGGVKESERDLKTTQRKEQMKNLLITKFRGKYIGSTQDDYADRVIREQVETFLINEQMTEQNLVKLDQRLNDLLGGKGTKSLTNGSQKKQNDLVEGIQQYKQTGSVSGAGGYNRGQSQDYRENDYNGS